MEKMTLEQWGREWLEYKRDYVKESTYANYLFLMERQIFPNLGRSEVERIDSGILQRMVRIWLKEGRIDGQGGLSQKTVRDILMILKMCLRDYGRKYGRTVPDWQVELPVRQFEANWQKRAVLSKGQQQRMLEWIRQELNYETLGYAVTLYTGIRIGELCALKWGDVDFEQRSICISKTIQRIYLRNSENQGNIEDGENADNIENAEKHGENIRRGDFRKTKEKNLRKSGIEGESGEKLTESEGDARKNRQGSRKRSREKGTTKVLLTTPKSRKSIRQIPIADALYELMKPFCGEEPEHFLVTGSRRYMEPRLYRKHYAKFLEKKESEYIHFHGLRHTFATRCVEAGADYKVVSELLGHASVNLTLNLYVHPQWEDKKRCVELI